MTDFPAALLLLRTATNNPAASFRDGQWESIDALVNRRERLLVVQRTGWGKSSVYFIATRILRDRGRGLTLIVSPLLALMRNQIEAAERLGIRALTINSTNRDEWPALQRAVHANETDALLISPERLANDTFVQEVLLPIAEGIGLLVVDEAHCISDWGHDFRPDYRRLGSVLRRMPDNVPILGTTATANDRVIEDVRAQLGNIGVRRGTLTRTSLALQTIRLPAQGARLAWLADHIDRLPGTGIIYTLTRPDAEQVADWLNRRGIIAKAYYGDVQADGFADSTSYRRYLEDLLSSNEVKALVATPAMGMGYDKPDLGFVVHYQAPGSIVAYYQQVGRAGRGIDYAVGILMSGKEDGEIHEFFRASAFPREETVESILAALEDSDGLTMSELERAVNLRRGGIEHVLKFLSVENPAPLIKDGQTWLRTAVPFDMNRDRIRRLTEKREVEWREVQAYIDEPGCLMAFLARTLDDPQPRPCGRCERCTGRSVVAPAPSHDSTVEAGRFLRRVEMPLECRKRVPAAAFADYPFRGSLPVGLRAETGRILSRWGDAGWGRMVADDKHNGHFRDELVDAVAEMIRARWRPEPAPVWVTCIPSRTNPALVPHFAERLAIRLGLPFAAVVAKIRDNDPQKVQQNGFHQCNNLDGAFAIAGRVSTEPVLLVDDVVDSRWTLTVAAALLRDAGSGPVWPIALTSSGPGG